MSKIRLILGIFLVLAGLSSCRPREVLSRSEMTDVLYDIHLTEAMVSDPNLQNHADWTRGMTNADFRDMAYQSVLKKHGLTEKDFYASVQYYSKDLRIYSIIYADVNKRFDEFLKDIDEGKYGVSSTAGKYGHIKMDSVFLRKCNELVLIVPDSVLTKPMYLPVDSLPTYSEWVANQWIYKVEGLHYKSNKSAPFSLILPIQKLHVSRSADIIKTDTAANNQILVSRNAEGIVKREIVALEARRNIQGVRNAQTKKR